MSVSNSLPPDWLDDDDPYPFAQSQVRSEDDEWTADKDMQYRIAQIPKGAGAFRTICIPSKEDKRRLRLLVPELDKILAALDKHGVNYAFEKGKNCVLNALRHVGHRYTLSMDLHEFFDSVTREHVEGLIPDSLLRKCLLHGSPRQGLPTSPLVATIAFLRCDDHIIRRLKSLHISAVYTRYADDLMFSFDERKESARIRFVVERTVEEFGFKLNERKTRLQDSANGRVIITGLATDANGVYPTRVTKRKIRAATHQNKTDSLRGLVEWAKCKLPACN